MRIGRVVLNAFGIAIALAGFYTAFLTIGAFLEIADLAHATRSQRTGLAGPAVMVVGMFEILFAIMFGLATIVCLKIAALFLHPVQRWRDWRTQSRQTI